MVKKSFLVLCLCIVALSCAFAGKSTAVMQVSPFSYQNVSASSGSYKSTYGYGFGVGFRYEAWKNINLGFDIDVSFFNYKQLARSYDVVSARVVGGYTYDLTDRFFVTGELGIGMDERSIGEAGQLNLGLGVKLEAGFKTSESFKLTAGTALDLSFHKARNSRSTDFAVRPFVGFIATL